MAQLESECATDWFDTRIAAPGEVVGDPHNGESTPAVKGLPEALHDLALSQDGKMAVTIEGSSVALWSIGEGAAVSRLAASDIGSWREDSSSRAVERRDALVMVQWLDVETVSKWFQALGRVMEWQSAQ